MRTLKSLEYFITDWIASAWESIITFLNGEILEQMDIYTNHCWNCKHSIKSTKTLNKLKSWLGFKWFGNIKCT